MWYSSRGKAKVFLISGGRAQFVGKMMVVFNAVEERDLRSRNSDACRERLGRGRQSSCVFGRSFQGQACPLRLPPRSSRQVGNAVDGRGVAMRGMQQIEGARWRMLGSGDGGRVPLAVSAARCNGEMREKVLEGQQQSLCKSGPAGWVSEVWDWSS